MTRTILGALSYAAVVFPLAFTWHLVIFEDLYARLGYFGRQEPIIALGLLAIAVQGLLLSAAYPLFDRGGPLLREGLRFGLGAGAFLWTIQVVATAAKHDIGPLPTFLAVESAYVAVQFALVGVALAWVHRQAAPAGNTRPATT